MVAKKGPSRHENGEDPYLAIIIRNIQSMHT